MENHGREIEMAYDPRNLQYHSRQAPPVAQADIRMGVGPVQRATTRLAEREPGEIAIALTQQDIELDRLVEATKELTDRLSLVLMEVPDGRADDQVGPSFASPLARRVLSRAQLVRMTTEQIQSINRRLAL